MNIELLALRARAQCVLFVTEPQAKRRARLPYFLPGPEKGRRTAQWTTAPIFNNYRSASLRDDVVRRTGQFEIEGLATTVVEINYNG